MRIGFDISQVVYEGTGVARYVRNITAHLVQLDRTNEYIVFGASLRRREELYEFATHLHTLNPKVQAVIVPIPVSVLDMVWNRFHVFPIELFIGDVDVFWSSDWTQPPLKDARCVTTIHDLTPLKYQAETHARIVAAHKKRLSWVAKECKAIFCDSEATKKDVSDLLGIPDDRLYVIYPGYTNV